jgi:uncharacterized protein (DUF433 family)
LPIFDCRWLAKSGAGLYILKTATMNRAPRPWGDTVSTESRIEINPKIMLGKPVIRGTRITVELILRKLGEGATDRDLLEAYPQLTNDDIKAAIAYAADTLANEQTVVIEPKA